MTKYDWSKCKRETLEKLADTAHTWEPALRAHSLGAALIRDVEAARAEAAPKLRTRAEVDAELVRCIRDSNPCDLSPGMALHLARLCAEPLAPEPEQQLKEQLASVLNAIAPRCPSATLVEDEQKRCGLKPHSLTGCWGNGG